MYNWFSILHSLVRNYYTGAIFEVRVPDAPIGSICGGDAMPIHRYLWMGWDEWCRHGWR